MKTNHLSIVLAAAILLAGCGNNPEVTFSTAEDEGTFELCEGCPATFTFSASIEYPDGGLDEETLRNMQENFAEAVFGEGMRTFDIRAALERYREKSVENYRDSNLEGWEQYGKEGDWGASFTWEEYVSTRFLQRYGNMQSCIISRYGFTGGAHGMDAEDAIVFDLGTGDPVSEGDLFTDGWESRLAQALTAHLRDSFEDEETFNMLFVKEIEPNGNFFVTEQGITYIYGRYEIGPYVIGIVQVTVPWEEIKDLRRHV
ncbi:MAG: DUF3298 domain-containing protein [Candidatus Cryptobacteroides sp.]